MKKTGSGKWTARYENSGHDEITALGDRFNEMAENTNQLIDQVYLSEIHRQKLQLSWKKCPVRRYAYADQSTFSFIILWISSAGRPCMKQTGKVRLQK